MRVKTAIVGLGYWGPNLLRNFAAQPGCEVMWACDLKEENLKKVAAHYPAIKTTKNYKDILVDSSIELIILATSTETHEPLARAALETGKHVFIEKPMTKTSKEAGSLITLAKKKTLKIFVDHTFVFTPAVEKIATLVKQGKLGNLLYYDSVRINLGIIQKDANVLEDLAVHDLSILSTITDLRTITSIAAFGSKHFGPQEEDAHLHLTFSSGFHAHIHCSWLSPVKIRQTILAGTKAMVTYHDTEPSEKIRIYDRGVDRDTAKSDLSAVALAKADPFFPKYRIGDITIPAIPLIEALSSEAAHVLNCIREKEKPRASGEDGRNIVRILELANEAMRKGKTMKVRL